MKKAVPTWSLFYAICYMLKNDEPR